MNGILSLAHLTDSNVCNDSMTSKFRGTFSETRQQEIIPVYSHALFAVPLSSVRSTVMITWVRL